jgi:nitrite reductase/ring-hydroxylating ferredoxin subunit
MKEAGNAAVLLYRSSAKIYAIGNRCTHAGGPIGEGKIDESGWCVHCPWHGSVSSLEDGRPVHRPASVPEVAYDVRISTGRIEVRVRD